MKKILVLNSGSSSLKYQLFFASGNQFTILAKGLVERIGTERSSISCVHGDMPKQTRNVYLPDHEAAIKEVLNVLLGHELANIEELAAVGHRMGHGGEYFDKSVIIDENVMAKIYDTMDLLPLHGAAFVHGVEAIKHLLPDVKQVATFDSAYHQTMPKEAFLYALPIEQYEKHRIRKYGFHGTSHCYVAQEAARLLGFSGRFISCHLGNGASITAIKDGKSIDTTMGFTPMVGMMMGTRCGDIDAYVPFHIMKTQHKTMDEVNNMLNKESGMLGLSGYADMRDIEEHYLSGDERVITAVNVYIYQLVKYIGSFIAALGGLDALIFTAGIGENSSFIRKLVCDKLRYAGIYLDDKANHIKAQEAVISRLDSPVKALVIPTNEELMIAKDTYLLLNDENINELVA